MLNSSICSRLYRLALPVKLEHPMKGSTLTNPAIRTLDLREGFDLADVNDLVPRASVDIDIALESVQPLIADVAQRGLPAVVEVTIARDGVDPNPVRVSQDEIEQAIQQLLRHAIASASLCVQETGCVPPSWDQAHAWAISHPLIF